MTSKRHGDDNSLLANPADPIMSTLVARFGAIGRNPAALAVGFVFAANGCMFANWVVRIPTIKDKLALSDGTLGLAITAMAVGGIIAMPLAGAMVARVGSARMSFCAGLVFLLSFWMVGLAPGPVWLAAALFLAGAGNGAMDVSMNAQANAVESATSQRIMSFAHAMFSLGLFAGTVPAGIFAHAGTPVAIHLAVVGAVLAAALVLVRSRLVADAALDDPDQPNFAWPRGPLLLFGLICLCGAIMEGAMSDWIAVYVEDALHLGSVAAATAYGFFAGAMFFSRLFGDVLSERIGPAALVRWGLILAAAGLVFALSGPAWTIYVGFAAVGLGIAGVFPAVFRAAGRIPGPRPRAVDGLGRHARLRRLPVRPGRHRLPRRCLRPPHRARHADPACPDRRPPRRRPQAGGLART